MNFIFFLHKFNDGTRQKTKKTTKWPKNIQIDDDYKYIDYSETDADGIPLNVSRKWFRKIDENGNVYFLTSEDSKLLYSAYELFFLTRLLRQHQDLNIRFQNGS